MRQPAHMSHMPRARRSFGTWPLLVALALVGGANTCLAVTHLKRGSEAPGISLTDQGRAELSAATLRGKVVVLLFGEFYHEKTREAYGIVDAVVRDDRLAGQSIVLILVTTQEARAHDLKAWPGARFPPTAARDPERRAFGAYKVTVLPSVVVIDREGRVVFAVAGLVPRFGDLVGDSVLYACGKMNEETFLRSVRLDPAPSTQADEKEVRADRLASFARQLARRGLPEMAAEKYQEAIQLHPTHASARLGLGVLLVNQRRLSEGEAQFRAVLESQPDSSQALLGLAFVQTLRGGAELDEAEKSVRGVLVRNPSLARAHYLLGLILDQRNKPAEAAASFKKASELLLDRTDQE